MVFDGIEVDGAFTTALAFHNSGDNSTFRNGRIGNVIDEKGALVSGSNFTFDNVEFHDVRIETPRGAPRVPVRDRRAGHHGQATPSSATARVFDMFFTSGSGGCPLPPALRRCDAAEQLFTLRCRARVVALQLLMRAVPGAYYTVGWSPTRIDATDRGRSTVSATSAAVVQAASPTANVGDTCGDTGELDPGLPRRPLDWNPAAHELPRSSCRPPAIDDVAPRTPPRPRRYVWSGNTGG